MNPSLIYDDSAPTEKVGALITDEISRFIPFSVKSFSPQNPVLGQFRRVRIRSKNILALLSLLLIFILFGIYSSILIDGQSAITKTKYCLKFLAKSQKYLQQLLQILSIRIIYYTFSTLIRSDEFVVNTQLKTLIFLVSFIHLILLWIIPASLHLLLFSSVPCFYL